MTSTFRFLAALAIASAASAAGASQITGTGIGATNHPTIAGTTSQPMSTAKGSSAKPAKSPNRGASSPSR